MKEFGARKSLRFIPTHHIARSLGPNKSLAFQFFHAISGCGMMSSLSRSGKARNVFLTCGHAWMRLPHYSKTCHLLQHHTKSKIVNYNYLSSLWKDYIQKLATQKKWMRQEEFSFPGIRERDQEHRLTKGALRQYCLQINPSIFKVDKDKSLCAKTWIVGMLAKMGLANSKKQSDTIMQRTC